MPWPPTAWAVMIPTTVAAVEIVTLSDPSPPLAMMLEVPEPSV